MKNIIWGVNYVKKSYPDNWTSLFTRTNLMWVSDETFTSKERERTFQINKFKWKHPATEMSSEIIFFQKFVDNIRKSIFYVSAVNIYCSDIFEGFSCRFFGFLFKIYFKNIYFDTGSNYLYMNFLFRVFPILVLHI